MTAERASFNILLKVTRDGAFANLALKDELSSVSSIDAPKVTALVYTAVEHMTYCDRLIDSFAKGRLHFSIRCVLRLALTEIFFMNDPDHAAVSKALELTKDIGKDKLKGYVNGVLRSIIRARDNGDLPALPDDFAERMEILTGYPKFMAEEYAECFGEDFAEKLMTARVNETAIRPCFPHRRDEIEEHLNFLGIAYRRSGIVADSLVVGGFKGNVAEDPLFKSGAFTVQSEGATLACLALDPKPGMNVLDACAAPGGKTVCIADIALRRAKITAWDIHEHRVELIRKTLARLGVKEVVTAVRDASAFDDRFIDCFDAVLCDAPCSGLGGGSKPDALMRRTKEKIIELAELQLRILLAVSQYVKVGGTLVYSTCTISRRENEGVIERFLRSGSGFELTPFGDVLPKALRERASNGMLTIFPNADGAEGFFIAKLIRRV